MVAGTTGVYGTSTTAGLCASSSVSMYTNGIEAARFSTVGTADTTNYELVRHFAGGGSASVFTNSFTRTGVTTSAVQIGAPAGAMDVFYVVGNSGGGAIFNDIVLCAYASGTVTVITSKTSTGSPSARTYGSSGSGSLTLQMASGTYTVHAYNVSLSGR
jgi:hypothetical protein